MSVDFTLYIGLIYRRKKSLPSGQVLCLVFCLQGWNCVAMTLERGLMGHHQIPVTWLVGLLPSKCELVLLSLTGRYSKNRKNNICTHQIFNVTRNILSLSYCNHFKRSLHVRGCWEGQIFFLSFYHLGNKEHAGKHRMDWEKIPSKNRLFDVHYSSPKHP